MKLEHLLSWLTKEQHRRDLLFHFQQPATALQLARHHSLSVDRVGYIIWELCVYRLLACLNPQARRSRLYWLTPLGVSCQRKLRKRQGSDPLRHDIPQVDWDLYGWVCYSHRSAVIRAMHVGDSRGGTSGGGGMQPAAIRRRACQQNATLRMSANNVRDVMRLFLAKRIVRAVRVRKKKHLRYELTEIGQQLQNLLNQTSFSGSSRSYPSSQASR